MSSEMPLNTVAVTSNNYPSSAQVTAGVTIAQFYLINASPTTTVYFTFNRTGAQTVDEGVLLPGASTPVPYTTAKTSVWFRTAGANQSANVYVMGSG